MRVLFAAFHVPSGRRAIGGVQSWIKTIKTCLERQGHECHEWEPGMAEPEVHFDLGVFANMSRTQQVVGFCRRVACVSHGIIPDEKPGPADVNLFVSEEVRDQWGGSGAILRQPIDLDFWTPSGNTARGVVAYSYRGLAPHCDDVAKSLALPFNHVSDVSHTSARDVLRAADLVFASGRAALEAMACGAPVVVYDHRAAYQGPLLDTSYPRQMRHSYSGRGGFEPSFDDVLNAAKNAKSAVGWVHKHHCAEIITRQLMEVVR